MHAINGHGFFLQHTDIPTAVDRRQPSAQAQGENTRFIPQTLLMPAKYRKSNSVVNLNKLIIDNGAMSYISNTYKFAWHVMLHKSCYVERGKVSVQPFTD